MASLLAAPAASVAFISLLAGPASAQVLQGRVVDADRGRPIPQTMIRLVDAEGVQRDLTVSDLQGGYRLQAPAPGLYRIEGERIGFEDYRSAEVDLPDPDAVYGVDLVIRPVAIPIRGLEVTARRREAVERDLRLVLGVSIPSIRHPPIFRPAIEDHLARGHDLGDLIRWSNLASVFVQTTRDGPCVQFRGRGCMDVYLNGVRVLPEVVPLLPLEMAETVVVLLPGESIQYVGGAVLVYTAGWLGR